MLTRPDNPIGHDIHDANYPAFSAPTPGRIGVEVVRHFRLVAAIALATTIAALLAWYALLVPAFESEAYLAMDPDNPGRQKAMFYSPVVLDPVIAASASFSDTRDRAREALRTRLTVEPAQGENRRSPSVFVLRVKDADPEAAHAIATAVLDQFISSTRPGAAERARLEADIARASEQRDQVDRLIRRLDSEADALLVPGSNAGELATPLAKLATERAAFDTQIETLNRQLEGMTADAILSAPTMPDKASRPVPLVAAIAAGLLLGLFAGTGFVAARFAIAVWLRQSSAPGHRKITAAGPN